MLKFIASLVIASAVAMPVAFAQPKHDDHDHSHRGPEHHRSTPHHMAPPHHDHHHYTPGNHYRSAPHGWHRYHSRPDDWRTRGCIVVGPVWFCP